jgi:ketopantoate reductase
MIIIGAGRVGTSLKKRSEAVDIPVTLVDRTSGDAALDGPQGDPILVATRNDDLLDVIERVPEHRHEDLVFIQNGVLRGLLRNNQLSGCTRGLIYFAATERHGDIDPGTISWFTGPHALELVRWFAAMDLKARKVDWARFSYYEFEKLTWLCVFGVLCDAHDCTVGDALAHEDDLRALVDEMTHYGRGELNVDAPQDYLLERLGDYTRSIPEYRASVKEWDWRNGAVLRRMVDLGERRMPATLRLLREGGHGDRLTGLA